MGLDESPPVHISLAPYCSHLANTLILAHSNKTSSLPSARESSTLSSLLKWARRVSIDVRAYNVVARFDGLQTITG